MSMAQGSGWKGERFRTAAKLLFWLGGLSAFLAGATRSLLVLGLLVALPLLLGTVFFVLSSIARREQRREWDAYTAGIPFQRPSRWLTALTISVAMLVPPAVAIIFLFPERCGVISALSLPWPQEIRVTALVVSLLIAALGLSLVFGGLNSARMKSASEALVRMWAIVSPLVVLVLFFSVYGDPGPGACSA